MKPSPAVLGGGRIAKQPRSTRVIEGGTRPEDAVACLEPGVRDARIVRRSAARRASKFVEHRFSVAVRKLSRMSELLADRAERVDVCTHALGRINHTAPYGHTPFEIRECPVLFRPLCRGQHDVGHLCRLGQKEIRDHEKLERFNRAWIAVACGAETATFDPMTRRARIPEAR